MVAGAPAHARHTYSPTCARSAIASTHPTPAISRSIRHASPPFSDHASYPAHTAIVAPGAAGSPSTPLAAPLFDEPHAAIHTTNPIALRCREMALDPITELEALVDAFEATGIGYAVCGGLALAVHGHPRATKDVDVLVRSGEVDRAIEAAKLHGFDIPARTMTFGLRTTSPREIRRFSKLDPETSELMALDLLIVNPELEPVFAGRLRVIWRGRPLAVVSREGLVTMKRIAGRPQDLADIAKLEGTEDEET